MTADLAISCEDVWKSYRIYHQRSHTLKEKFLSRRNRYEEFWALKGIDLQVPVGTTLGIIGANGSGKSTLLKTMARILTPNRGRVRVNGSMSSLLELGIGFHPELTGRENVHLSGSLLGQTRREVEARYEGVVEFAGIEEFMDTPVKNYSTGMYARLAFAVAISVEPEILLVDEVLSVGDESFQMRCYERITEFRRKGRTIVLVSHSLDTIRTLCDEAVWVDGGEMRQVGEARDVVASYLAEVHGGPDEDPILAYTGRRFGSGEAVITDVRFLDAQGEPTNSYCTGERMTIHLDYRAEEVLAEVSCAVSIFRAEPLVHLWSQNTREAGLRLDLAGEGSVEFAIPSLPLLKGGYLVSVALHDPMAKKIYDWHERRYSFMVFENPDLPFAAGIINVPTEWAASPSHAPA
ncbi:MAG TPA: ABC transporter ATP-binding protein [Acidimicrobiales bacterium]|jgi:ABC-2 type transport system ATP-binding protein|nr:ABC transporter ATP-binding protein [Acidimicrobiales bacterium]